jgi:type VI secretion system protein ImpG
VSEKQREFHIIPDKTRTSDFEIIQINRVTGIDTQQGNEVVFQPFFSSPLGSMAKGQPSAYYASQRQKRTLSQSETLREKRVSYAGSEVFLSIVDHESLPFSPHLRQLSVEALCSNRDLPLFIKRGVFDTDLSLQEAPVKTTVRFLIEPTVPRPSLAEGIVSWRLINLLSLNYLSMIDAEPEVAANAIRQFLRLYVTSGDDVALRQIDAVRRLSFRRVVRRVPLLGPLVYAQGVEARLILDESLFEGSGGFMFGKVLEVLFSQMSTINSFVETVVESLQRGEIKRWPARLGNSPLI